MKWAPLLILPMMLSAEAARATTLAEIHARGFLTVGVIDAPSPFGGVVDGKAAGFDAALIAGLAKSAAIEIHQQPIAPGELEEALGEGKVDLVASSVEIATRETASAVIFTSPVAEATRYY